ncbi:ornithine carbamoyltransferase [Streptomyces antarcticus]|uniref:ornithine carbamoyltransferase n=1 Tax=Streptomyces antarcticus TaxID=2996458 RepID=UPI00226D774E|nr:MULTISPECIES: ornithine carbamoyltransferase [unclassified Streptomyces]MCY0941352.1 ornithine carbamoyltransferase [Streptomyces sp. H34-AA3]MCZ4084778.1 ornithine carbamoyltransferase [Streptomyces sp. H34-S5]
MALQKRSLLSTDELTDADLRAVVARGVRHSAGQAARTLPLTGDVVGVYFRMTSTRTRTAFSAGALRLGAQLVSYGPDDLQTNTGESLADTGRMLGRMLDVVVARTGRPQRELARWAAQKDVAVVNAMTAEEHPTQALADLTTLQARFGRVEGLRVLYTGEGNNTAAALALALTRFRGVHLELRTPAGHGLSPQIRARAEAHARRSGATLAERHHMDGLPAEVDAVYTSRWQTTGTSKADQGWRAAFAPFQVTAGLWEPYPKAVFLHDLPAHRGEEVTAEVLDGPMSVAFEQAENKMHSAMAVLEWCRGAL